MKPINMNHQDEDTKWIDQFLSGEEEGFIMLARKYQQRVHNITFSLIGAAAYVEDIVQEVFIKIYHNLASFQQRSSFATWLYRITINTTYRHLKREGRYCAFDESRLATQRTPDFCNASERFDQAQRKQFVWQAITKLPFKYRTVLILKDIEGLSYRDIGQAVGCRIGTVESRLFRARGMLRSLLEPVIKKEQG